AEFLQAGGAQRPPADFLGAPLGLFSQPFDDVCLALGLVLFALGFRLQLLALAAGCLGCSPFCIRCFFLSLLRGAPCSVQRFLVVHFCSGGLRLGSPFLLFLRGAFFLLAQVA